MFTARCGVARVVPRAEERPVRRRVPCWEFKPQAIYGQRLDPSLIEVPDGNFVFTQSTPVPGYPVELRLSSIIIAVDGACSGNGTPWPEAAVGVYVGDGSQHNASLPLDSGYATSQKAELVAGIYGLDAAREINKWGIGGQSLTQVIIKTDSAYMVNGVTQWVNRWEANGYINADGGQVTNHTLFKELTRRICELAEAGVKVYFWHVLREHNLKADGLANLPLMRR
ncbi:hypothetical protein FQN49_000110 [Arthroderma sp. PD_2]|nr:hypothetical protein FQN49_000110 [Arthroderma sp. PD_2]